jgi:hypothetical protein
MAAAEVDGVCVLKAAPQAPIWAAEICMRHRKSRARRRRRRRVRTGGSGPPQTLCHTWRTDGGRCPIPAPARGRGGSTPEKVTVSMAESSISRPGDHCPP